MIKFLWQVTALLFAQCIFVETITTTGGQVHDVILLVLLEKELNIIRHLLTYYYTSQYMKIYFGKGYLQGFI